MPFPGIPPPPHIYVNAPPHSGLAAGPGEEATRERVAHPKSHVATCVLRMCLLIIRSVPPSSQGAPHQGNGNKPWGRGRTEIDSQF